MALYENLQIEYWARIHELCKDTHLNPWECVRRSARGVPFSYERFTSHPQFENLDTYIYEFAFGIVEGVPVFRNDILYDQCDCDKTDPLRVVELGSDGSIRVVSKTQGEFDWFAWKHDATWQPAGYEVPESKTSFDLIIDDTVSEDPERIENFQQWFTETIPPEQAEKLRSREGYYVVVIKKLSN